MTPDKITIKDASTGKIATVEYDVETISGLDDVALTNDYEPVTMISDGTSWYTGTREEVFWWKEPDDPL